VGGGGSGGNLCNLFRIIKWKHMFMKADTTRDINALRCNVKTPITKVRGVATKKHTWREMKIQFMIVIGMQKRENGDTQKYAKNDNQETVETNNQTKIYLQEQE
jgi:hypothetical protein